MNTINFIGCHYKESSSFEILRPVGSSDHLLLLFHTPIDMVLDNTVVHCSSGTLMLYEQACPQHYFNKNQGFINDFVHFDNDELRELASTLMMPVNEPISITNLQDLHHLFLELEKEHLKENHGYEMICDMLIKRILIKGLRSYYVKTNQPMIYNHEESIRDLRLTIMSNLEASWSIEKMCHQVDLSRSRFNTLYTAIFNISPKRDLQTMRIELGKRLLVSTNLSISQISERIGYESIYHFSKQFKKETGISPRQFRQSNI